MNEDKLIYGPSVLKSKKQKIIKFRKGDEMKIRRMINSQNDDSFIFLYGLIQNFHALPEHEKALHMAASSFLTAGSNIQPHTITKNSQQIVRNAVSQRMHPQQSQVQHQIQREGERPSSSRRRKRKRRLASEIVRSFKCNWHVDCQKAYGTQGALDQHIRKKHMSAAGPARPSQIPQVLMPRVLVSQKQKQKPARAFPPSTVEASELRIANWIYKPTKPLDLIAAFFFDRKVILWEIFCPETNMRRRIEMKFADVCALDIRAQQDTEALRLRTRILPAFYVQILSPDKSQGVWRETGDFTGGMISPESTHSIFFPVQSLTQRTTSSPSHYEKIKTVQSSSFQLIGLEAVTWG
eukprot:TRINITY_DN6686_c0_g1_i1.p1 TRINITY_DN6686_c0_g1~~TRINITY_DN6686_c0_g1_i1.p1  ORF type:complete len:364 (-),score=32.48 TRINITY_DN6686_c0_g1_i1:30-1085(-)